MAIPFILGGLALVAAGTGVKKAVDASEKNEKAERIARRAKRRFDDAKDDLESERDYLNRRLESFGKFKLRVFENHIQNFVDTIKCYKKASSELNNEIISFIGGEEFRSLENSLNNSLEISSGLGKGVSSGALIAYGTYGTVGMLASASTGTAISTLSGAAATNATLAWLGGGSLAVGGGGMALGTAVLGGMVAGPLIAVTGFVMDSKAEENLSEAYEYEAEADRKVEQMKSSKKEFEVVIKRINELENVIKGLIVRLENIFEIVNYKTINNCSEYDIGNFLSIGKGLKNSLNISLLDDKGNLNTNFRREIEKVKIS